MRHRAPGPSLALLMATAIVACGEPETGEGGPGADAPARDEAAAPAADDTAPAQAAQSDAAPVRVWFHRAESLVAVPRPGADPSLRGALESLLAGPTPAERSRGFDSWFEEETRDALQDVRMEGDRALIDFDASLPSAIPGAGSSAGSEVLLGALDSTVFQFPSVQAVEYRLDGSCDAFWEWLQRECAVVRR